MAKSESLSWAIFEGKKVLISFNREKLLSPNTTVAGIGRRILMATAKQIERIKFYAAYMKREQIATLDMQPTRIQGYSLFSSLWNIFS